MYYSERHLERVKELERASKSLLMWHYAAVVAFGILGAIVVYVALGILYVIG